MSRKEKQQLPNSGAGITRYFDDYKSRINFKPKYILLLVVIVIIIEVFLHING